jgi:Beta-propeller repeat
MRTCGSLLRFSWNSAKAMLWPGILLVSQAGPAQSLHTANPAFGGAAARAVPGTSASAAMQKTAAKKRYFLQAAQNRPLTFVPDSKGVASRFVAQSADFALILDKAGLEIEAARFHTKPKEAEESQSRAFSGGFGSASLNSSRVDSETSSVHLQFIGASSNVRIEGLNPTGAKSSYFIGRDSSRWRTDLPSFTQVRYGQLYPGIDLVYYGGIQRKFEYDLVVRPGADPSRIHFRVDGSQQASIDAAGNLLLDGPSGQISLRRPVLYQDLPNGRRAILGSFRRIANNEFGFVSAAYDHSRPLIIDPKINLVYSTYAGGIHNDQAWGISVDGHDNTYVIGYAASQDFPVTGDALQTTRKAIGSYTYDVVLMKFDPSGTLLYSTFLGGSQTELGLAVVVDPAGNAWIGGETRSTDFPVTANAYQKTLGGGQDAFFSEVNPDGSALLYSTYLGGTGDESIFKLLLNSDGSFWMTGEASAAGLTPSSNAFQSKPNGTDNIFVAKAQFDKTGALQLPFLTFLGGSEQGQENSGENGDMAVDSSGNVYVASGTYSGDFPVTANAYEKPFPLANGCTATTTPDSVAFVTKFSPDLSQELYSTVVGGKTEALGGGTPDCNQFVRTIHLDAQGNIWLVGTTGMSDFPVTANALAPKLDLTGAAGVDYFIAELSADGSKELYGSFLGGSAYDYGAQAVWDTSNNIWIRGNSQSADFPTTPDALDTANVGGYDITLTELNPTATQILYSTYFGGTGDDDYQGQGVFAFDSQGNLHLAGETASTDFPVTQNALQPVFANGDTGPDGDDIYYTVLGQGAIGSIGPATGGNAGDTTVSIGGAGFQQGATCSLVQNGVTILTAPGIVNATGTAITCTFALNGASSGSYDVVVSNPDGSSFTKKGGFAVQSGGQPNLWVNIVGRPLIRTGVPSIVTVNYGNSGTEDAYFVGLSVSLPQNVSASYNMGVTLGVASSTPAITAQTTGGVTTIPMFLPHLPAGSSGSFVLTINDATNNDKYAITATIGHPWYASAQAASADLTSQSQKFVPSSSCAASPSGQPTVASCLAQFLSSEQSNGLSTTQVQGVAANMLTMLQQSQTGPPALIGGTTLSNSGFQFETGTLVVSGIPSTDDHVLFHVKDTSEQYLIPINSNICTATGNANDAIGGSLYTCTFTGVTAPVENGVAFAGIAISLGSSSTLIPQPDACFTVVKDISPTTFNVSADAGDCHNDVDVPEEPSDDDKTIEPPPIQPAPGTDPTAPTALQTTAERDRPSTQTANPVPSAMVRQATIFVAQLRCLTLSILRTSQLQACLRPRWL